MRTSIEMSQKPKTPATRKTQIGKKLAASPARVAAFEILRRVEEERAFASVLLAAKAEELQPKDRSLCHELILGVLRRQSWLDRLITHYANRNSDRLDAPARIALRLGLYQLRFLSRVPASAVVNESVILTRVARLRSAEPLVNAVLRRALREPNYDPVTEISDPIEKLAVETSHPGWLIDRWTNAFGVDEAAAFARANNDVPPLAFRIVNEPDNGPDVLEKLQFAGAVLSPSKIVPGAWRVTGAAAMIQELARRGRIYIQDEASQLVGHVVDAQAGDRVLDVCAAPGSKTTQLADLVRNEAVIVASDLHRARLRTLMSISALQGVSSICCVSLDASRELPFDVVFDRVLVDAPCAGTGTLRHNPEIRWRIRPQDIEELSTKQARILQNASLVVKPGGRLIYSTCSVEPEENEQVVSNFVGKSEDFKTLTLPVSSSLITASGAVRTWPHRDGADGFFIAAFERRE